jgi:hypothetical protein
LEVIIWWEGQRQEIQEGVLELPCDEVKQRCSENISVLISEVNFSLSALTVSMTALPSRTHKVERHPIFYMDDGSVIFEVSRNLL